MWKGCAWRPGVMPEPHAVAFPQGMSARASLPNRSPAEKCDRTTGRFFGGRFGRGLKAVGRGGDAAGRLREQFSAGEPAAAGKDPSFPARLNGKRQKSNEAAAAERSRVCGLVVRGGLREEARRDFSRWIGPDRGRKVAGGDGESAWTTALFFAGLHGVGTGFAQDLRRGGRMTPRKCYFKGVGIRTEWLQFSISQPEIRPTCAMC